MEGWKKLIVIQLFKWLGTKLKWFFHIGDISIISLLNMYDYLIYFYPKSVSCRIYMFWLIERRKWSHKVRW